MIRLSLVVAVAGLIAASPSLAQAQAQQRGAPQQGAEQQELVDRATLAAQDMLNDKDGHDAQAMLRQARAVMICPQVFRAGFLFGAQGGGCVLTARDGSGSWSSPAFYGMGSGSFGFQAGLEDSEIMMMILTERGLRAVMDDQFKLGADAGAVFVQWGGGIEGATTAAAGADIVGFTRSRGLFAGISLSGSVLSTRSAWNRAYYGREEAAQQIVISMDANNPGASPLREVLGRFGSNATAVSPMAANSRTYTSQQVAQAQVQQTQLQPVQAQSLPARRGVQQQSLPPPSANRY